jgi:RNA polymerase sigma-70 factor (ECF subfamily)
MAVSPTRLPQEQELLTAARAGDEDAFARIVGAYRTELHAHCYRMLASLHDAEDAFQETLLRAWRGVARFEGRSSLRTWLYTIATNVCLDAIARRPKRVLPVDYGPEGAPSSDPGAPLVESVWIEPYPDDELGLEDGYLSPEASYEQREAIELAFVAALQHLPAKQRAVLILREVLGYSAAEVSHSLETTVASVNSALQRARKTVSEKLPERSQQQTLRSLGDARTRELVDAYVDAWARGDADAVRALLTEDAIFSMPPWSMWWRGSDTIAAFAAEAVEFCAPARPLPVRASGQPAVAYYSLDSETGFYSPAAIDVLTLRGDRIAELTAFIVSVPADSAPSNAMPTELLDLFQRFGLPAGPLTADSFDHR